MIAIPNVQRRAIVSELIGVGNFLDGAILKLFKADYTPGPATVLGDLTAIEADFTGYAASAAVVWGPVFTDAANTAFTVGDVKTFASTGSAVTNTIYGYWAQGAGGLMYAERFDAPIPVLGVGDGVVLLPRFSFGQ